MSNEIPVIVKFKCWADCTPHGCPGHKMKAEYSNTSDTLKISRDGKVILVSNPNEWAAMLMVAEPIVRSASGAELEKEV